VPLESPLTELLEEALPSDWRVGAATPAERMRSCLAGRNDTTRALILQEVEDLRGRGLCDMQLSDLVAFELGCHLRPSEMGLTPAEWLAWVGRQVAAEE
jgi:hypothetical protein